MKVCLLVVLRLPVTDARVTVIKKPMDLSTMLRNIKQHKYKAKADFAADLNLIWDNCALYNHEVSHHSQLSATSTDWQPGASHPSPSTIHEAKGGPSS